MNFSRTLIPDRSDYFVSATPTFWEWVFYGWERKTRVIRNVVNMTVPVANTGVIRRVWLLILGWHLPSSYMSWTTTNPDEYRVFTPESIDQEITEWFKDLKCVSEYVELPKGLDS